MKNTGILMALALVVLAPFVVNAKAFNESSVVDFISTQLVSEQLFLVTEGDLQPFASDSGEKYFNFEKQGECNASNKDCQGLLVNYSVKTYDECLHPNLSYRFDELPIKTINGQTAVFTVPTITDPSANNRDFFVFHDKGVCYEFDWGYGGSRFDKSVDLANKLIGR